jgi:hypothetical protein
MERKIQGGVISSHTASCRERNHPIVISNASWSCLLATGFHTCKYMDILYMMSASCEGYLPSIENLFLMFQRDHRRAAQQIDKTRLVCPPSSNKQASPFVIFEKIHKELKLWVTACTKLLR